MLRVLHVLLGSLFGFLLYSTSGVFGLAAVLVNLFIPLPAAVVGMRHGAGYGTVAVLLSTVAVSLVGGPASAGIYLVQFGLPAALLPWFLARMPRWDRAVAATLAGMLLVGLLVLVGTAMVRQQSPWGLAAALVEQEVAQTSAMMDEALQDAALSAAETAELQAVFERTTDLLKVVYPGLAVTICGVLVLFLNLLLAKISQGRKTFPGPQFARWKLPEPLIWLLIAAGFVAAFGTGIAHATALNLLVVLLPIYFLQGMAVVDCFLRRRALSPLLRSMSYLLVTLVNPLPMIITGIGVFDLWIDFRKPREPKT